jgi:hypothetical protein
MPGVGYRPLETTLGTRHAILAAPGEGDDRMMRLAARAHDLGVVNRNHQTPVVHRPESRRRFDRLGSTPARATQCARKRRHWGAKRPHPFGCEGAQQ